MTVCNTVQYDQGSEAAKMFFCLVCKNAPLGTIVNLSSDNQNGPVPPISIQPTVVQNPSAVIGIYCQVPANYEALLKYCYKLPGVNPPPDFSITLEVLYSVSMQKKTLRKT